MRTMLAITALGLLVVGCSSGGGAPPAPQGTASYGPPARTAPGTRTTQPSYAAPAPARAPGAAYATAPAARAGAFRWHTRIADAQAQARAEGKLILVGTTQPGCSLCEKFKNQIVPSMGNQVASQAVGYMLHAPKGGIRPEAPHVWTTLAQNLRNAGLMPLVGVFSPDLRYLTGFGGPPDQAKLMNALAQARRMHPVAARAPAPLQPERRVANLPVGAQINEFGEYEWTPVPLWPEEVPEEAAPLLAEATSPPVPVVPVAVPAPSTPDPVVAAAPAAAVAAPPARSLDPEAWARAELERARQAMQAGQYDQAMQMLESVKLQMPATEAAREAARGGVALYNVRRIRSASPADQARLRAQARQNLGETMWGPLFG